MKILLAPDKFKGSLSALEVCQAIKNGLEKQGNTFQIKNHPMADGGDGSVEILAGFLNFENRQVRTLDPRGRAISAKYFTSADAAFIEVASASGLVLLSEDEKNPLLTSTFGTGVMIADALENGFRNIYLFLGGSATNDAGIGIAKALGFHFLDKNKNELAPVGENLSQIRFIQPSSVYDFSKIKITLLCDVKNPMFGTSGAAYVYAAQKGATEKQIIHLDEGLRSFSQVLKNYAGRDVSDLPGGGAAGAMGAGLVALLDAKIENGFDTISQLTHLEQQIEAADWVISGEGKLDKQSIQGKVIDGVSRLCQKYNKPLFLVVGKNDLQKKGVDKLKVKHVFSITEKAENQEDAMANAAKYLEKISEEMALE